MVTIGINPVAFAIGTFEVRWYGIMVLLGVVATIVISLREAKRVGFPSDHIYNVALWAIISGILVSRLFHVIDRWDYYWAHPEELLNFAGLTIYGAVIGALLAIAIYGWVKKISFWKLGDIIAPGAILGQAIGRVGCLLNGCCYGFEEPPTCVGTIEYTNPNYGLYGTPLGVPLLPTAFYHLVWNLIVFGILWGLRRRLKPQGTLFLTYFALYALGDLVIRSFREGQPFLFGLQQAQLIGIVVLLITVPWLAVKLWRGRRVSQTAQNQ
jgi:phosphatidylglycerol:prolipoprotein diacylglycerol transferase